MYKACIIEDEESIRSFFKSTLERLFKLNSVPVIFDEFATGDSFIASFEDYSLYDIIFLDIEMPGINGIDVCKKIRQMKADPIIVFISSKESLVFDTFEVEPFRFVRKRFFDEMAPQVVKDLKIRLEEKIRKVVSVTESFSGNIYTFDLNNLLYIEAQRKDCCFVTKTENVIIRIAFQEVMELLSDFSFVQTHRSYFVNLMHVFYIGKDQIELTTKDVVPVSRSKIDYVKTEFLNFSIKQ